VKKNFRLERNSRKNIEEANQDGREKKIEGRERTRERDKKPSVFISILVHVLIG